MPFAVQFQQLPGYVRVVVSGPASVKNYFDLFQAAARSAQAEGTSHVLLDLRGVQGRLAFTDQFYIGEVVGEKFGHLVRVALVVASDPGSYNTQKVANRKGANLQTFDDEAQAIAWLLAPAA